MKAKRADPYPNEHAARMIDPKSVKVVGSKEIAPGIRIILGKRKGQEESEVQAYRFSREKFTAEQARAWLKEQDKEPILFEEAKEEDRKDSAEIPPPGEGWQPLEEDIHGGEVKRGAFWPTFYRWPTIELAAQAAETWEKRAETLSAPDYMGLPTQRLCSWDCQAFARAAREFAAILSGDGEWSAIPGDEHGGTRRPLDDVLLRRWPTRAAALQAEADYRRRERDELLAADTPDISNSKADEANRRRWYLNDVAVSARTCAELLPAAEQPRADSERVTRYDAVGELLAPTRRDDGTLLCEGYLAKPGVLLYRNADGSLRRELVPRETIQDADWLASIARAPVTIEHPAKDVTPENVSELGVGDVDGDVEILRDTGFVRIKLAARRRDAIDEIEAGRKRGLSPGYSALLERTPGVDPEFGAYDAIQRQRRCNHVALCGVPRGGPDIVLRGDSAVQVLPPEVSMFKIDAALVARLDAIPALKGKYQDGLELSEFAAAALMQLLAEHEELEALKGSHATQGAELEDAKTKLADACSNRDRLQGLHDGLVQELAATKTERDALRAKVDTMEPRADSAAVQSGRVAWRKERTRLEALAAERKVVVENVDSLDNAGLARAIARALRPEMRADATDDYVLGLLDALPAERREDAWDGLSRHLAPPSPASTSTRGDAASDKRPAWVRHNDAAFESQKSNNPTSDK